MLNVFFLYEMTESLKEIEEKRERERINKWMSGI